MGNAAFCVDTPDSRAQDEEIPFFETHAFADPRHVGCPNTGDVERFVASARDIFERRWFTNNGAYVRAFEARLEKILNVRHCIPVCNATVGLGIAARALGMEGEVIVPGFTFVATAHALSWQNVTPVFCDVDPRTHNIDPEKVEALITPRTTGVLAVHVWGRPCAVDALAAICRRHRLKLLFDAAHAFTCGSRGVPLGNFGDAEVFSFHATKFVNTFEGGAIATNDDALAGRIRLGMNFGFAGVDTVVALGVNGKMSEISAAMGLSSLESADQSRACNLGNYTLYRELLEQVPGISLISYDEADTPNYHYVVAEIDESKAGFSRDALVAVLERHGVFARRYFHPGCHRMEPYRSRQPELRLPATERLCETLVCLPTVTAMTPDDVRQVCEIARRFHETRIRS